MLPKEADTNLHRRSTKPPSRPNRIHGKRSHSCQRKPSKDYEKNDIAPHLQKTLEKGVSIRVCSNSMKGFGVEPQYLVEGIQQVSSGVGELTRLQTQGYAYIKP